MKPYPKTYRASKIHKANECGICAESVESSSSPVRQKARKDIYAEDLRSDDVAQAAHDEQEEWQKFCDEYTDE